MKWEAGGAGPRAMGPARPGRGAGEGATLRPLGKDGGWKWEQAGLGDHSGGGRGQKLGWGPRQDGRRSGPGPGAAGDT